MTEQVLSESLVLTALASLPGEIRVDAFMEMLRWVKVRERETRVAVAGVFPPPAHETAATEAQRRTELADPAAPLWLAMAEEMRLRAATAELEQHLTDESGGA